MKTLRLPLITKYFDMTKDLIKGEDYRLPTPYWYSRLCLYNGKKRCKKFWEFAPLSTFSFDTSKVTFQHFDTTTLTLGYPSNSDKERIIEFENLGISIGYGKEEWGAEKDKLYFVIKHGKRIR